MGDYSNENGKRDFTGCGNLRPATIRQPADRVSRLQPQPQKENGPVLKRDFHAGRDRLALLALFLFGGAVL